MAMVGFIVVCVLAVILLVGGVLFGILSAAFDDSVSLGIVIFLIGCALSYYAWTHAPFHVVMN
jgi:hypothetical protein